LKSTQQNHTIPAH